MGECKTPVVTILVCVNIEFIRYLKQIYFGIFTVDGAISAMLVH